MTTFERDETLPLSNEEMRRLKRRQPSGKVPKEFAGVEDRQPPAKTVKFIERAKLRKRDVPKIVDGHAPPWLGFSFSPKRAGMPPPPIVTRHGERLDPLVIHPLDDRRPYSDTSYPWVCVCRITTPSGGSGSGVLIGPRHVLTASHVVEWTSSAAERIEVHFAGNAAQATAFTQSAYAFTAITGGVTSTTVDEDYAVITLTQRLGDRFGFFGAKVYDAGWDDESHWTTIGYPGDVATPNFPHFQQRVSLDEDEWDLGSGRAMTTSADCMKGQSGSPMFGRWAGDPIAYAVAVVSAAHDGDNYCAGGSDLNRIIAHARATDP